MEGEKGGCDDTMLEHIFCLVVYKSGSELGCGIVGV